MIGNNPTNERVSELKKAISTLEWDIPYIKDKRLRTLKNQKLRKFKRELQELLEKNSNSGGDYPIKMQRYQKWEETSQKMCQIRLKKRLKKRRLKS